MNITNENMGTKKQKPIRYVGSYIETIKHKRFHISFSYEVKDGKTINETIINRVELKNTK